MKYLIFVLSLITFSLGAIFEPLRNWDEAWYAEIIKNMALGKGTLLVPFWQGQNYFDKGPLYFWFSLPIVKIFGLGDWQVRFVSIIAASFCCLLVYLISKRFWTSQNDKKVWNIGLVSVLIFVSLGQVFVRFSHGNIDSLLIALFLGSYYFWLKGGKSHALLSGILMGLSFLVKGWTLGLFPLFVITLHSLLLKNRLFPKDLIYIIVGAISASLWWYILSILTFGSSFYNWYLFTPAEGSLSITSFSLETIRYFFRDVGIWWVVIISFILVNGSKLKRLHPQKGYKLGMLFIAVIFTFIFALSFAKEKLDWHNLPVYPFISIVLGWISFSLYKKYGTKLIYIFLFLLLCQAFISYRIENIYPDRSRVGAKLGDMMSVVKNPQDIVVLNDHDFTSFLYYSNVGKVYVVSKDGGKPGEFWTLKYSDLPEFISSHKSVVLVSKDPKAIYSQSGEIIASGLGYSFVRY